MKSTESTWIKVLSDAEEHEGSKKLVAWPLAATQSFIREPTEGCA